MAAVLNVRRISFVSVLVVAIALVFGVAVGSVGAVMLAAPRTVVTLGSADHPTTPTAPECRRFGGPLC